MTRMTSSMVAVALIVGLVGCKHAESSKAARTDAKKAADPAPAKPEPIVKKAPAKAPAKPAKPLLPAGIDKKDLDESEVKVLAQIVEDQFDPCGKPRSFRQALEAGDCALAHRLVRFMVHKLQQG